MGNYKIQLSNWIFKLTKNTFSFLNIAIFSWKFYLGSLFVVYSFISFMINIKFIKFYIDTLS